MDERVLEIRAHGRPSGAGEGRAWARMLEGWERGRICGISPPAGNKGRFLCPAPAIRSHPPEWLELKEMALASGLAQPLNPSVKQSLSQPELLSLSKY